MNQTWLTASFVLLGIGLAVALYLILWMIVELWFSDDAVRDKEE